MSIFPMIDWVPANQEVRDSWLLWPPLMLPGPGNCLPFPTVSHVVTPPVQSQIPEWILPTSQREPEGETAVRFLWLDTGCQTPSLSPVFGRNSTCQQSRRGKWMHSMYVLPGKWTTICKTHLFQKFPWIMLLYGLWLIPVLANLLTLPIWNELANVNPILGANVCQCTVQLRPADIIVVTNPGNVRTLTRRVQSSWCFYLLNFFTLPITESVFIIRRMCLFPYAKAAFSQPNSNCHHGVCVMKKSVPACLSPGGVDCLARWPDYDTWLSACIPAEHATVCV